MSIRKKQAGLTTDELIQVKWLMGCLLTLLAFWSLLSLDFDSGPFLLVAIVLATVRLFLPGLMQSAPAFIWRLAVPVLVVVIAADFAMNRGGILPPLVRMVVLLMLYRVMGPRGRREDLQLVLLSLFCLVVSGVLTLSLLFALQILLFTPLALAQLFVVCLLDRGKELTPAQIDWEGFQWRILFQRLVSVMDFRVLGLGGLLFAFVVAVSSFLFVLMPRFDLNQAIPFMDLGTAPRSGFSDTVSLSAVSEIREDNTPALRVDVPSLEAIEPMPYWRMLVLDAYNKGHFSLSREARDEFSQRSGLRQLPGKARRSYSDSKELWTFYLEGGISKYLPLAGDYESIRFDAPMDLSVSSSLSLMATSKVRQSALFYQLENMTFNRRFAASRYEIEQLSEPSSATIPLEPSGGGASYPLNMLDLRISDEERAFLSGLNERILGQRRGQLDAVEFSEAATTFLREGYSYSLRPDLRDTEADPVITWLREGKQGHCELFASSFILLAREAGFPARMAIGFAGGAWNPIEAYYVVRNSNAHAWVEIYDASTRSWLRVDPTPGNSPNNPEIAASPPVERLSGANAWIDSLRIQWYRRVVNFDQSDQVSLWTTFGEVIKEYFASLSQRMKQAINRMKEIFTKPFEGVNWIYGIFAGVLLALPYLIFRYRYILIALFLKRSGRPKRLSLVRKKAGEYLIRMKIRLDEEDVLDKAVRDRIIEEIASLEALRFGPDIPISEARNGLDRARRLLRSR